MKNNPQTILSVSTREPENPVFVFRPSALERAATYFQANFKAKLLYAVKTNPEPHAILGLAAHGVGSFDVASLAEIKLIRSLCPDAECFFMHPVKARHAITQAYHEYGIRQFSLDSREELEKILECTGDASDLGLHLRLSIPNSYAELNLGEKFGVNLQEAHQLLKEIRAKAKFVGVSFHVGSQCMHPDAYRIAMRMAAKVIRQSGVSVDFFNVGGGFPSIYPGMIPPALKDYFEAIHHEFAQINQSGSITLLAEPGRALVAESSSLIVRVELRKGNVLYINDGTYGGLFDAGTPKFIFPVHLIREGEADTQNLLPFSFYGPTCDSLDFMKGPFYLPRDVKEGDYIEIGQMGAYGRTLVTSFNGFGHEEGIIEVVDEPLMTMYGGTHISNDPLEVIAA